MVKKKYYIIYEHKSYYGSNPLFRFEDLDGALEMFKYLVQGKSINLDNVDFPDQKETPDEDGYVSRTYIKVEAGEVEYHVGSEIVEVYTKEEAMKIKKEAEAWLAPFKKVAEDKKKKEAKK